MSRSRALVLFARTPEAEARAKGLHAARTAPLFEAVIAMWLRAAERAGAEAIVACAPQDRARLSRVAAEIPRSWIDQPRGGFGKRLSAVATAAFGRGFERIVLTGIDTPPADLGDIFQTLENGRAVIAPCGDGGVNLIGLIADAPDLLSTMSARQRDAAARCCEILDPVVLDTACDIDGARDLAHAMRDGAWRPLRPCIAAALGDHRHEFTAFVSERLPSSLASRAPPGLC